MEVQFVPITVELAYWFNHKRDDLPAATRELLEGEPILDALWDSISPDQRRDAAAQWDYQHDPATEQERQHFWNIWCEIDELETEVKRLKELRPTSYEGDYVKKKEIRELEVRIGLLNKSLDDPHLQDSDEQEAAPPLQISTNVPADPQDKVIVNAHKIEMGVNDPHFEQPSSVTDPLVPEQDDFEPVAQPIAKTPVSSESATASSVAAQELKNQDSDSAPSNCLILKGDFWQVRFKGREVLLKSTTGLHLLRHLLRHPHKGYSVYEIQALLYPVDPSLIASVTVENSEDVDCSEDVDASEELNLDGATDLGPVMDYKSIAAYKVRLKSLAETIQDRKEKGDTKGAHKAQDEMDQIIDYMSGGQNRDGKSRRMGGDYEKTRVRIGVAINRVKEKLGKALPELMDHLSHSLQAGAECKYDPEIEINWDFGDS